MADRDPKSALIGVSSIPPSHASERVSQISRMPGEELEVLSVPEEEAVTASHHLRLREIPASWLDRLLLASLDLPISVGEEAVMHRLVDALKDILVGHAVGACLVPAPPDPEERPPTGDRGESRPPPAAAQVVFTRVPQGDAARVPGPDPTRLFQAYTHERIREIRGSSGTTLHVAGDDVSLDDDRSPVSHLADRAADVLSHGLARARAHAATSRAARRHDALEAHVIQAEKLASFGQIAAGLVHELNNPLTSIVAYSDFLIRKELERERTAPETVDKEDVERLRRISESAFRMLRFTRDLVTYARPSGERPMPVALHAVIDQAIAFCEHVLEEARATVDRRYGADVHTVRGRPEQLAQVFVNLITNACHAMPPEGGVLVIATDLQPASDPLGSRPAGVRIIVEDNGHGIPEENLPHVFAPFFTTKRERHGTGLGLSIVKSIVENHDGTIHVDGTCGVGTRFVIVLPMGARA